MQSGGTAPSVSDPYLLETDPVVKAEYRSRSRVLITKNWRKKFTAKTFLIFFYYLNLLRSTTTIYLSLGLQKGRPSYRRSLQPSENVQNFKT
jgi:hypothetical protein